MFTDYSFRNSPLLLVCKLTPLANYSESDDLGHFLSIAAALLTFDLGLGIALIRYAHFSRFFLAPARSVLGRTSPGSIRSDFSGSSPQRVYRDVQFLYMSLNITGLSVTDAWVGTSSKP